MRTLVCWWCSARWVLGCAFKRYIAKFSNEIFSWKSGVVLGDGVEDEFGVRGGCFGLAEYVCACLGEVIQTNLIWRGVLSHQLEHRLDVSELALQVVLELDHWSVLAAEHSEATRPVFNCHVGLFVRIKFGIHLLHQLSCHVKSCQSVVLVDKELKCLEVKMRFTVSSCVKALLECWVVFGEDLSNLLNGSILPVEGASRREASPHGTGKLGRRWPSGSRLVRVCIAKHSFKIAQLQSLTLEETEQLEESVETKRRHFFLRHTNFLNQCSLKSWLRDLPAYVQIETSKGFFRVKFLNFDPLLNLLDYVLLPLKVIVNSCVWSWNLVGCLNV